MLEFHNVTKRFGEQAVLQSISWKPLPGEISLLSGLNGSGKTTLLKMVATLIEPTSGEIRVGGTSTLRKPIVTRSQVAYAFPDERGFYWKLTGRQNLEFFGALQGLTQHQIRQHTDVLAGSFQLEETINRPFQQYSSGMRQRLSLIRALLPERPIYLLDEPQRHLDKRAQECLASHLQRRAVQGSTVIVTSVDEDVAWANQRYVLRDGTIQKVGS